MTTPRKPGRPKISDGLKRRPLNLTLDPKVAAAADAYWRENGFTSLSAFAEYALKQQMVQEGGAKVAALESLATSEATPAPNVVSIAPRPQILAAAGSPISAEVIDWDGDDDTVRVGIYGLSMAPLLNDGDVVSMKLKKISRNPHMKKGMIYLVEYDGGKLVKRYNTRKATEEERDEEWAAGGRVIILESENSEFPPIVVKEPLEWIAWLDKETEKELKARL